MTSKEGRLIHALENNVCNKFAYFPRVLNRHVYCEDSLLVIDSNELSDMFNIICCRGNVTENKINDAINYFRNKKLPFSWWTGFENEPANLTDLLEKNSLQCVETETAMFAELNSVINIELPENLVINKASNKQHINDLIYIIAEQVPQEREAITNIFSKSEKFILDDKRIQFFIGYMNHQRISTCSVFFSDDVAGIFDIIVSPSMRGKGIGLAMTTAAMQCALLNGYHTCVLLATNDARFVYEKIGFRELKLMHVYS